MILEQVWWLQLSAQYRYVIIIIIIKSSIALFQSSVCSKRFTIVSSRLF